jgi:methionine synthase II (cobalamin-independent)
LEPPEDAAGRIRRPLDRLRPEKLWINPDCGFFEAPRWIAVAKPRAMVAGTRYLRKAASAV